MSAPPRRERVHEPRARRALLAAVLLTLVALGVLFMAALDSFGRGYHSGSSDPVSLWMLVGGALALAAAAAHLLALGLSVRGALAREGLPFVALGYAALAVVWGAFGLSDWRERRRFYAEGNYAVETDRAGVRVTTAEGVWRVVLAQAWPGALAGWYTETMGGGYAGRGDTVELVDARSTDAAAPLVRLHVRERRVECLAR